MTTAVETGKKNNNKWLWIGLGGAALFCLCAVVVAGVLFTRIGQQFAKGVKTTPEEAAKAAHAIVDYDLPAGYQEQMAMDFSIYSMVMIGPGTLGSSSSLGKPIIMLAQFRAGMDQQQMEQQLQRSFEQQSGQRGQTMKVVETKKATIRGEEVEVTTYEGTDNSGNAIRELLTTFPGKGGTAMLMIMGSPDHWDQAEIDAFIASIR